MLLGYFLFLRNRNLKVKNIITKSSYDSIITKLIIPMVDDIIGCKLILLFFMLFICNLTTFNKYLITDNIGRKFSFIN
jgi:hypothetical protein